MRNTFQKKEQGKVSEKKKLNEVEISNLSNKEFKVMIIKILNELRKRMDEQSENFNKKLGNTKKKNQAELNMITEIKIY